MSGFCRPWYVDVDSDGHGDPTKPVMLCSPSPEDDEIGSQFSGLRIPFLRVNGQLYSGVGDDCCDVTEGRGGAVFPQQTNFFTIPQTACPGIDSFDYDCSGDVTDSFDECTVGCNTRWVEPKPACGGLGNIQECSTDGTCPPPTIAVRACK